MRKLPFCAHKISVRWVFQNNVRTAGAELWLAARRYSSLFLHLWRFWNLQLILSSHSIYFHAPTPTREVADEWTLVLRNEISQFSYNPASTMVVRGTFMWPATPRFFLRILTRWIQKFWVFYRKVVLLIVINNLFKQIIKYKILFQKHFLYSIFDEEFDRWNLKIRFIISKYKRLNLAKNAIFQTLNTNISKTKGLYDKCCKDLLRSECANLPKESVFGTKFCIL